VVPGAGVFFGSFLGSVVEEVFAGAVVAVGVLSAAGFESGCAAGTFVAAGVLVGSVVVGAACAQVIVATARTSPADANALEIFPIAFMTSPPANKLIVAGNTGNCANLAVVRAASLVTLDASIRPFVTQGKKK
jgi:hypothetical protein